MGLEFISDMQLGHPSISYSTKQNSKRSHRGILVFKRESGVRGHHFYKTVWTMIWPSLLAKFPIVLTTTLGRKGLQPGIQYLISRPSFYY